MAEVTAGIFPDLSVAYDVHGGEDFVTEIQTAYTGREQRRSRYPVPYRRWTASSNVLTRAQRQAVRSFLRTQKGRFGAFNFWNPLPESQNDVAGGTVTAVSRIIVPYRITNPNGTVIGSLTDVRVAGVTLAFTSKSWLPRPSTYAALKFPGGSQSVYVDCGTSATLRPTGDMAVAAWVYRNSAQNATIVSSRTTNASGFMAYVDSSGTPTFLTDFASSEMSAAANFAVPLNTWTHVAFSRSGGPVTFYLNGVQKNTSGALTNPAPATISLKIGSEVAGNTTDGMLSDVRLYVGALTAQQVLDLFNNKTPPNADSNLHGWWKLTEGTGTTAADSSGNANTGTLTGAPVWVSGEEEITFTGGNQTGAVTLTGELRDRVIVRSDMDSISYGILQGAAADLEVFTLALKEVY